MKLNHLASAIAMTFAAFSASAAQYEVVELTPLLEKGVNNFATSINETGDVVSTVQRPYNLPIDRTLLDFDSDALKDGLTDIDAAREGNFNQADYLWLFNRINLGLSSQRFAQYQSFSSDGNTAELVTAFDRLEADLGSYTMSADTFVSAWKHDYLVGSSSAPFYTVRYTTSSSSQNPDGTTTTTTTDHTNVVHDFATRGFVQNGDQVTGLPAPDTTLGGFSQAFDINDKMQVVGYGTTATTDKVIEAAQNCADDEKRGDQPVEVCRQLLINAGIFLPKTTRQSPTEVQYRGLIWQLDNQGKVISTKTLGLLVEPDEDDPRFFQSRAVAINNNGIAVGYSNDTESTLESNIPSHAAIYDNDEVIGFINKDEYASSEATAINNNNLVVGIGTKRVNGFWRTKFFVHNIDSGETVFPKDFFLGSASVAHDINDNGLVVGEGEVEATINQGRRREAFIYDTKAETFTNINSLLECDTAYKIVEARQINENNEIVANALVSEVSRNVDGSEILDDAGNPLMVDKVIAVKLVPIANGVADDCPSTEEKFERKGASSSVYGLALLMLAGLFRRLRKL